MAAVRCEWGLAGVEALHGRAAVIVIVDVLSFSTCEDVAVSRGAVVFPFPYGDKVAAQAEADRVGAVLAQPREVGGKFSLSPVSLRAIPTGTRLLLPSPNGSRLSWACGDATVFAGCLRNAGAVAAAARAIGGDVAVIPAGERWPDGSLRPAIEDLLGAGAIIHHLGVECSAEAEVARRAFRAAGDDLGRLVRESVSGRELIDHGFPGDVEAALEVGVSACVPMLVDGAYRAG